VTSLVLVPSIVDTVKIPVIAAGGFADGRGLASGAGSGRRGDRHGDPFHDHEGKPASRFLQESLRREGCNDTLYSDRFDGLHCRVLDTRRAARRAIKKGLDLPAAFFTSQDIARQLRLPYANFSSV